MARVWRDDVGKTLKDYPRPSVAVDVALLTVTWHDRRGQLAVLLYRPETGFAADQWCLPGTFLKIDEVLADAALRVLRDKVGVAGRSPRQLKVFDAVDRDERGRVLSAAHVDVAPEQRLSLSGSAAALAPVVGSRVRAPGGQRRLPYDHDLIVAEAVDWARTAYRQRADPFGLLGEEFTLSDLQKVHEAVAGQRFVKDTFRRGFSQELAPTGRERIGTVGRPAALYRQMTRTERHAARRQQERPRAAGRRTSQG